ncbi:MAG TPA: class I SAM-dependent methyltransferase, partial [Acidimicrobiales bacterium]|nr:class I SAM-dependent methyltransferase [Acidimicrobiales bacterium]
HNKICNLEDFTHPELYPVIRDIFAHEVVRFGDAFPVGKENRKDWEAAMALRAFQACGLLDGSSEFLGVAAGNEPLLFHLTRLARRVFATDLYLAGGDWEVFGHRSMLDDPYEHWPFEWNPRRLVVQHMDALDLRYEDESFDGVFSSSSIEHFGGHPEVERSMDEMFRVLRPGGVCAVTTEFRLAGPSPGIPGCLMFDPDELASRLIGDRAWTLISPLDLSVSDATLRTRVDVAGVVAQQLAQCDRDGGWFTHKLDYEHFPHIVMGFGEFTFTSIHLALRKDAAGGGGRTPSQGEWERARRAMPLAGTHTVALDVAGFTGAGWQESPPGTARWTGPGRDASVDLPVLVSRGTVVEVLVEAAAAPSMLEGLRVELNGLPVELDTVAHEGGTLVRGAVPGSYASARGFTRVSLRTPEPPAGSEGGVAVRWIRLTSTEGLRRLG